MKSLPPRLPKCFFFGFIYYSGPKPYIVKVNNKEEEVILRIIILSLAGEIAMHLMLIIIRIKEKFLDQMV